MSTIKLFVEGGGNSNFLRTECRSAFNSFLNNAGLSGYMPRIVACGSRNEAYSNYCTAVENNEEALLLVDSEVSVLEQNGAVEDMRQWRPWYHLKNRRGEDGQIADGWDKPQNASDEACHLMVESMETWFLADTDTLREYYGQGFNQRNLPRRFDIENISKHIVMSSLSNATKFTQKGCYSKSSHSFGILSRIDPYKVVERSPWAKRFITLLSEIMHS